MSLSFAYFLAFISVIFNGVLPVLVKKGSLGNISPFSFMSATMFVLFSVSSIAALVFDKKTPLTGFSGPQWQLIVLFGFINFISFALFTISAEKVSISLYQFMTVISIFVGILLSLFFLGEPIKPSFYIGGALVTAGLYIVLFK